MASWLTPVLAAILAVAWSAAISGQEEAPAAAHDWMIKVEPMYPREARVNRIEGYVRIRYTVTAAGEPANIEIVDSQPPGVFDEEAVKAFRKWRFVPAKVDQEYVETGGEEVIQFKLRSLRPSRQQAASETP